MLKEPAASGLNATVGSQSSVCPSTPPISTVGKEDQMKRQHLGDSKDRFKWDYHDFLLEVLGRNSSRSCER